METKDAIRRIKDFGLYHAIGDLPNSTLTVEAFNKAIRLLELEESGRLKILPCKEGEIVYKEIIQHDSYDDSEYKIISAVCFRLDMLNDMNKTIFLTREEAEEKLKEIK